MQLVELAYFTDNVQPMADFYQDLLNAEPIAKSDERAIFMTSETKIFIHHKYACSNG
jgi:hypothetical protein